MNQQNNQQNKYILPEIVDTNPPRPHVEVERYVKWVDGMPEVAYRNVIKKEALPELKRHALSQMYEGEWDSVNQCYEIDPRYVGMTKAEVIEHKKVDLACAGDLQAMKEIDDRLLGKPKQQVESKNLNVSYEDWLNEIARQEEGTNDGRSEPTEPNEFPQLDL